MGRTPRPDDCPAAKLKRYDEYLSAGEYLLKNGPANLPQARACFAKAAKARPSEAGGWRGLGAAYAAIGDHTQAVLTLRKALRADPRLTDARVTLGISLQALGEQEAAEAALVEAVRTAPEFGPAHAALGELHASAGRTDVAIAAFTNALQHAPELVSARARLARLLHDAGKPVEAAAVLEATPKKKVTPPNAADELLSPEEAAAKKAGTLHDASRKDGGGGEVSEEARHEVELGDALRAAGRFDDAAAAYARADAASPGLPEAIAGAASVALAKGDASAALAMYESALEKNPSSVRFALGVAHARLELGKPAAAAAAYAALLSRGEAGVDVASVSDDAAVAQATPIEAHRRPQVLALLGEARYELAMAHPRSTPLASWSNGTDGEKMETVRGSLHRAAKAYGEAARGAPGAMAAPRWAGRAAALALAGSFMDAANSLGAALSGGSGALPAVDAASLWLQLAELRHGAGDGGGAAAAYAAVSETLDAANATRHQAFRSRALGLAARARAGIATIGAGMRDASAADAAAIRHALEVAAGEHPHGASTTLLALARAHANSGSLPAAGAAFASARRAAAGNAASGHKAIDAIGIATTAGLITTRDALGLWGKRESTMRTLVEAIVNVSPAAVAAADAAAALPAWQLGSTPRVLRGVAQLSAHAMRRRLLASAKAHSAPYASGASSINVASDLAVCIRGGATGMASASAALECAAKLSSGSLSQDDAACHVLVRGTASPLPLCVVETEPAGGASAPEALQATLERLCMDVVLLAPGAEAARQFADRLRQSPVSSLVVLSTQPPSGGHAEHVRHIGGGCEALVALDAVDMAFSVTAAHPTSSAETESNATDDMATAAHPSTGTAQISSNVAPRVRRREHDDEGELLSTRAPAIRLLAGASVATHARLAPPDALAALGASQRVVYLPHVSAGMPSDLSDAEKRVVHVARNAAKSSPLLVGLVAGSFASASGGAALSPVLLDVWCAALRRVPSANAWIVGAHPAAVPNLLAQMAARGVARNRILLAPPPSPESGGWLLAAAQASLVTFARPDSPITSHGVTLPPSAAAVLSGAGIPVLDVTSSTSLRAYEDALVDALLVHRRLNDAASASSSTPQPCPVSSLGALAMSHELAKAGGRWGVLKVRC
ncbi:hypothetical protein RI054_14g70410 [Pseudoscourfieldia marina]